jgi:hypothetical protein
MYKRAKKDGHLDKQKRTDVQMQKKIDRLGQTFRQKKMEETNTAIVKD